MTDRSDAVVLLGATGDLAHRKIYPALKAMVKRGTLSVPVIGVASPPWTLADLRARATEMIRKIYERTSGRLPIIGVGGIDSAEAAIEKLRAGASLARKADPLAGGLCPRRRRRHHCTNDRAKALCRLGPAGHR